MVKKNINKLIIHFCILFKVPFPKKIQIAILKTARLHIHRFIGMCRALKVSIWLLYDVEYILPYCKYKSFIPIFNHDNFIKVTGIEINCVYWTKEKDKYNRIKFLKWCEENVNGKTE